MRQEPFINWMALQRLAMLKRPPEKPDADGHNMWDDNAAVYNKMSALEEELTILQVEAMPLEPDMSVIDLGCGCGRLTVPVAKRVKAVTALDSSRNMLDNCIANAKAASLTNVTPVFMDVFEAVAGENVPVHDFAFCSRSAALWDIDRISSFGSKYAAIDIWANAPTIPEQIGKLFAGTSDAAKGRPGRPPMSDRRIGYNAFWNTVYDKGYEPNISVVPDGFKHLYATREEAYEDLLMLGSVDEDKMDIYHQNVDKFLTEKDGGFELFLETRSCIIWWETHPKKFY